MTDFRQWREQCGFTIAQAGEVVGLTKQMASFLDRGWNGKHERCEQRQTTRKLMMAAAPGLNLEPWTPTKAKEKAPWGTNPMGPENGGGLVPAGRQQSRPRQKGSAAQW